MLFLVQFLLSGIITGLLFPPFFLLPIGFIIYPFLFYLLNSKEYMSLSYPFHFLSGLLYGLGLLTILLVWIKEPFLLDSFTKKFSILSYLLIFYCSLYFGLSFLILKYFTNPISKFIILPVIFVANEILIGNVVYGFPWISHSLILSSNPLAFSTIYFWGTYGLSYVTITFFLFPAIFLFCKNVKFKIILTIYFIVFIFISTSSILRSNKLDNVNVKKIKISLAQMNFSLNHKQNLDDLNVKYEKILDVIRENTSDILIFAENNFPYLVKDNQEILSLQNNLQQNTHLIIGSTRKENDKFYNSLYSINNDTIHTFDKQILVPFGEFIPFRRFLKFMEIIAGSTDFALGEGQRIVGINDELNFIPAICYEIIFFWKLINDENNNADFIINLTNDSWFGQLSGPYQHFYLSRLRAAEFNKPLIRVSNNGISAAIDNFGNIIDYIELNKKEVKEINIQIPELKNNFIYYHRFIFYFFILLFLMGLFLNKKNDT